MAIIFDLFVAEILQSQNQNVYNNTHSNAAANSVGGASMLTSTFNNSKSASSTKNSAVLSASLNAGSSVKTSHSAAPIKQNENKNDIRPRLVKNTHIFFSFFFLTTLFETIKKKLWFIKRLILSTNWHLTYIYSFYSLIDYYLSFFTPNIVSCFLFYLNNAD